MRRPNDIALSTLTALGLISALIALLMFLTTRVGANVSETSAASPPAGASTPAAAARTIGPPDPSTIPEGPLGDSIRRGMAIVSRTYEELPDHVGNGLHCTSCHLEGGTKAGAAPWVGLVAAFPEYRARSARVDTIERRINDCFERSMNGTPIDPVGEDMAAIVAYMSFISRGVPAGETPGRGFQRIANRPETPDRARGERLYMEQCAACHGEDGQGKRNGDQYLFPALYGPQSFNIGAGMARLDTAAAYIRANMPLGRGGSLSDQDAYDIADYFIHQDRPDWARRAEDWPSGGKPRDARY